MKRIHTNKQLGVLARLGVALLCGFAFSVQSRGQGANLPGSAASNSATNANEPADFLKPFESTTGIKLLPISAGTFTIGSPADEAGRRAGEGPQTQVTFTKGFWLAVTELTQAQWSAVMTNNPSMHKGDLFPVEWITWIEAMEFCQKLTERERAAGRLPAGYTLTLPTEAQWEYAARAGTTNRYPGDLEAMAWYSANSNGATHAVGTRQPNPWGLFDMTGNVFEWCLDWQGPYPGGAVKDLVGPETGRIRNMKGGGWRTGAPNSRVAFRDGHVPDSRYDYTGLRLALVSTR